MRVWEITEQFGVENLRLNDVPDCEAGPGQVKLKMRAASLNHRDLVVIQGQYGKAIKPPVIPLSDGVGEVVAVGPSVRRFRVGDRVCPIFFPDWLDGEPREDFMAFDAGRGASRNGTLREFMVIGERSAVKVPDYLTDEEAATLPCAAVTAWNALTYGRLTKSGDKILVQGTGGVSIFALQFGKMMGATMVIISSDNDKLVRAKELGADVTINYRTVEEWHHEVKRSFPGGVDRVVEVGGADTVAKSLKAVRVGGVVSLVGVLSGAKAAIDLPLVVMRFVRLEGITVGSREHFEAVLKAMEPTKIRPQIGARIPFKDAPEAFALIKTGGIFGKICITF